MILKEADPAVSSIGRVCHVFVRHIFVTELPRHRLHTTACQLNSHKYIKVARNPVKTTDHYDKSVRHHLHKKALGTYKIQRTRTDARVPRASISCESVIRAGAISCESLIRAGAQHLPGVPLLHQHQVQALLLFSAHRQMQRYLVQASHVKRC